MTRPLLLCGLMLALVVPTVSAQANATGPAVAALVKTVGRGLSERSACRRRSPAHPARGGRQIRTEAGRAVVALKRSGALVLSDHAQ